MEYLVNLSDDQLSPTELEVLNLGLKFVPTPEQDPTAQLAPVIQNKVKCLPDGMESSAIRQTTTILADYNPKQDKTPDNLTPKQRGALKKEGRINSENMRNMRQLHPRWPQLYGQPNIHKLGAPIRPVVSFYNTLFSALHKVLAHYLKPLANSSSSLKDTNDFKQHLNTTGHPNFPYHTSLDIKSI